MTTAYYPEDSSAPYVILAALSTEETGEFALYEAARLAASTPGSDLHVVHVVAEGGAMDNTDEMVALERRLSRAPAAIEEAIEQLQSARPARITAHLRAGDPARTILQTAVDLAADLVVVGSHQRTRLEKMIVGSVAERVLRGAHCPVLVAIPKNYDGVSKSANIEPPCTECVIARQESAGAVYWCERHRRTYSQPHVYDPAERRGAVSVMPTH
jgi:nucleotide-binding universal stress UspA family protein